MNPDTLVALPPITAAQRQLLISVLEHARSQGYPGYAERVIGLAHALDLHRDAVPVPEHDGQGACDVHPGIHAFRNDPDACIGWVDVPVENAAPDLDTCDRCGKAEERIHVGHAETLGYDGLCSACYLTTPALGEAAPGTEHPCSVEGCDNTATTHGSTCVLHL